MKKLFLNTLFFAALIGAQTSFAQERKAVESKPEPASGKTPTATQAAPVSNSRGQENRATPAQPATPASKSETRSATPATPAQPANRASEKKAEPAQPANKMTPAKNVKKAEAQPAPGQSRISVNEGGLPATKTENKKVD